MTLHGLNKVLRVSRVDALRRFRSLRDVSWGLFFGGGGVGASGNPTEVLATAASRGGVARSAVVGPYL